MSRSYSKIEIDFLHKLVENNGHCDINTRGISNGYYSSIGNRCYNCITGDCIIKGRLEVNLYNNSSVDKAYYKAKEMLNLYYRENFKKIEKL